MKHIAVPASLLGGAVLLVGSGCNATHLVYVHNANLGVDVSYSPEGSAKLAIGYDRETFALVPRRDAKATDAANPSEGAGDAMSLASMSAVSIAGLNDVKFDHLVATGGPAIRIAQAAAGDDARFKNLAEAAFGTGQAAPAPGANGGGGNASGSGATPGSVPPPAGNGGGR